MKLSEEAVCRCTSEQVFLKISQCLQKTPVFQSFFNKAEGLKVCIFIKKVVKSKSKSILSLLVERFLLILLAFDDIIRWISLVTKLTCFIFLALLLFSFITLVLQSSETPQLFRYCFYIKIFSKHKFCCHYNLGSSTILIELLKTRNSCRTLANYYFSLEPVLLTWLKTTQPKNKSMQKFRRH